jgi:hypothetical protein
MKQALVLSALLLSLPALAAKPAPAPAAAGTNYLDFSAASLIDADGAKKILADNIPAKVLKLYPSNKFAFVSQVQGGLTAASMCVVTARVMLLPLTPTVKAVMLRPQKTATAFDAVAGSNAEACKVLARDKLKEATASVVSSLAKT